MWFDETVYLDEHNLCTAFFAIAWNVRSASPAIWLPSALPRARFRWIFGRLHTVLFLRQTARFQPLAV